MNVEKHTIKIGDIFGRLKVSVKSDRKYRWVCKCECGAVVDTTQERLLQGRTKSCGCFRSEVTAARAITHGETKGGIMTPGADPPDFRGTSCTLCKAPRHRREGREESQGEAGSKGKADREEKACEKEGDPKVKPVDGCDRPLETL